METRKVHKGMNIHTRRAIAYVVLTIISFFCLFWFYILFVNATRSNGQLQSGFTGTELASSGELEESARGNTSGMERYVKQYYRSRLKRTGFGLLFNHDGLRDSCI